MRERVVLYAGDLFVSRAELRALLRGTRWRVEHLIDSDGPTYIAVLSKAPE